MISDRDRGGLGYAIGKKAEDLFVEIFAKAGWTVSESDKRQNIMEHWDFLVEKNGKSVKVDVKAQKRVSRGDSHTSNEWVWVEILNNGGYLGWLYRTHADYLAFQRGSMFYLVTPKRLQDVIAAKVSKVLVKSPHLARYKLFRRSGRKDLLTLVNYNDLPTEAIAK